MFKAKDSTLSNSGDIHKSSNSKISTKHLVSLSLFTAIVFILGMTPLGFLPIGIFKVVTVHVPVIIGSILLGPKSGAFLGFIFGLTSFITAHMNLGPIAYLFSPFLSGSLFSLVVCFVPRILVGIVPYYIYNGIKSITKNKDELALSLAGIVGSFTNTVFVMGFTYILFKERYAESLGTSTDLLLGVIIANVGLASIVEAITASLLTVAITKVLFKFNK